MLPEETETLLAFFKAVRHDLRAARIAHAVANLYRLEFAAGPQNPHPPGCRLGFVV